jgi:WD40 repeat protein
MAHLMPKLSRRTVLTMPGTLVATAYASQWLSACSGASAGNTTPQATHATSSPGKILVTYTEQQNYNVQAIGWSPDGTRIASGANDIHIWNASTGKTLLTYSGHTQNITTLDWSPDGKYIVSSTYGAQGTVAPIPIHVWEATTGKRIYTYLGHVNSTGNGASNAGVNSVAWSPDGRRILSTGFDHTAQVWDALTGQHALVNREHTDKVNGGCWSPDSKYVATVSDDTTVKVWNATTGKTLFTYGFGTHALSVSWSPDQKSIAVGMGPIQILTVSTRKATTLGNAEAFSLAWSPNGQHLASAGEAVDIWNPLTGQQVFSMPANTTAFAWSPDDTRIASVATRPEIPGAVIIWQASL